MGKKWYVLSDSGEQRGPLTEDEVRRMIASGYLHENSYCWCEDLEDWVTLGQVAVFAAGIGTPSAGTPGTGASGGGWDAIRGVLDRGKRGAIRAMKTAKLKMELGRLKKVREMMCAALGEQVYEHRQELALTAAMQAHVDSITTCDQNVAGIERTIAKIGSEPT